MGARYAAATAAGLASEVGWVRDGDGGELGEGGGSDGGADGLGSIMGGDGGSRKAQ